MKNQPVQISSFILHSLMPTTVNPDFPNLFVHDLQCLSATEKMLMKLGEEEHSSDWDPYLIIKLKSGQIETPSGYSSFVVNEKDKTIEIDMPEELDEDADENQQDFFDATRQLLIIPIDQIQSVQISE